MVGELDKKKFRGRNNDCSELADQKSSYRSNAKIYSSTFFVADWKTDEKYGQKFACY